MLDEANIVIYCNLFAVEELIDLLKQKQDKSERVMIRRYTTSELIELADLLAEMEEVKHYYQKGEEGRREIEC